MVLACVGMFHWVEGVWVIEGVERGGEGEGWVGLV